MDTVSATWDDASQKQSILAPGVSTQPLAARPPVGREAILRVEHVGKRFGEIVALSDVSMSVGTGEVFGVAGPNGAGKTTLFNVIAGRFGGTGSIWFEGQDIMGWKPHRVCRHGIARTFQIPMLFSSLSVADNVRVGAHFGARKDGDERRVVAETLEQVGMSDKAGMLARHLDLMGKKLTMLAAALATGPSLLLLDEPMGGLAPAEVTEFGGLITRLNRERGITIVVIEHLVRKLVELSDRLMILYHGEQIALGPPKDVVNDPRVIELYLGTADYA